MGRKLLAVVTAGAVVATGGVGATLDKIRSNDDPHKSINVYHGNLIPGGSILTDKAHTYLDMSVEGHNQVDLTYTVAGRVALSGNISCHDNTVVMHSRVNQAPQWLHASNTSQFDQAKNLCDGNEIATGALQPSRLPAFVFKNIVNVAEMSKVSL